MQEVPKLGRTITIRAKRKSNGAVGSDRKNNTGKVATICAIGNNGNQTELAKVEGANFREVSRALRKTGLVPTHVAINHHGKTQY